LRSLIIFLSSKYAAKLINLIYKAAQTKTQKNNCMQNDKQPRRRKISHKEKASMNISRRMDVVAQKKNYTNFKITSTSQPMLYKRHKTTPRREKSSKLTMF
jgi:hypothetical protein